MKHSENTKIKGVHVITKCSILNLEALKIYEKILQLLKTKYDPKEFRFLHSKLHKFINTRKVYYNTVVNIGRNIIANVLIPPARRTYNLNFYIDWCALGLDPTLPSTGNTLLGSESFRKAITDSSATANVTNVLTFWNLVEANGQHYEAGEFIDGTIALGSGNLFARWNIDELKTATETLSIDSYYTITQ
jgi:hypothetical protein